jgi:hypothetical protein
VSPSRGYEFVGKKLLGLDCHELRITDKVLEVGICELLRLDQMMEMSQIQRQREDPLHRQP